MRGSAMRSLPRALPYAPRVSRRHGVGASALPPPDLEQLDGRPVAELPYQHAHAERGEEQRAVEPPPQQHPYLRRPEIAGEPLHERNLEPPTARRQDRKSTRLNSSHSQISYAVFCLKKKKQKTQLVCAYRTA